MNKYQESLEFVNKLATQDNRCVGVRYEEYRSVLQVLVNKATPQKPIKKEYVVCCPNCKEFDDAIEIDVYNGGDHRIERLLYCSYCGQHIDWTKDE